MVALKTVVQFEPRYYLPSIVTQDFCSVSCTQEVASQAKKNGKWILPGLPPLKIFWHSDRGSQQGSDGPQTTRPSKPPLQQPQVLPAQMFSLSQTTQQEEDRVDESEAYYDSGQQSQEEQGEEEDGEGEGEGEENSPFSWAPTASRKDDTDTDPYSATSEAFRQIQALKEPRAKEVQDPKQQQQLPQKKQQQKKKTSVFDRLGEKVGEPSATKKEEVEERPKKVSAFHFQEA